MPQLQKGQTTPGANGAPELYGTQKVENTIPFQERLMRLFKAQEFVTIRNIDDEPLYWQYMPTDGETENMSEDGMQKQIYRTDPEMWTMGPGDVEVMVGANAYRALDVMYKNVTAKKTLAMFKDPSAPQFNEKNEHLPKNFNYADGGLQDAFIKKAYLGKAMPTFAGQAAVETPSVGASVIGDAFEVATPPVAPPNDELPQPKTTEGAPLAPVAYADPDNAAPSLVKSAKETFSAKSK